MKTNNISGIIIHCFSFFLLIVFFCSCSDELTEHPKTIVVENFYKTTEEVETATNAIYGPLRGGQMAVYEATLECLSDFVYGRGSWTQIGAFQKLNDTNITRVSGIWNIFYQSIRCANLVIQNSPTNNADAAVYVAEAKFLRAFAYFHLVRNWGGVPIRTESNMSETAVPKSTKVEVYNFIVSDLLEAEKVLPEKRDEFGRPSKWAVKTLLSDVSILKNEFSHHCDGNNTKIVTIESEVSSLKSGTWVFRWIATNQKLSLFILICVFVVIFGLDIGEILKKLKL